MNNIYTKIVVVPRILFEKIRDTEDEKRIVENAYVISINGSNDLHPFSFDAMKSGKIVDLYFDDIESQEEGDSYGRKLVLFNNEHANLIFDFVKNIPKGSTIVVHCTAGISRSGAVGDVLDSWFNGFESKQQFKMNNPRIMPNTYVRLELEKKFKIDNTPIQTQGDK